MLRVYASALCEWVLYDERQMKILDSGIAILEHDTHISRWVVESGRLDHDLTVQDYILPMLQPHFTAVDAGADIGSHTIRYAQAVAQVLAFEPNPAEFECLKHNLRDYGNATLYRLGLSDKTEEVSLRTQENAGAGYLDRTERGSVVCVPLDSFNLPRLDFFKLDVEGYELFALQGATKTISTHLPVILVEMNAGTLARNGVRYSQIFQFLSNMGYVWRSFAQNVDLLTEPQYDLLATPKTKTA